MINKKCGQYIFLLCYYHPMKLREFMTMQMARGSRTRTANMNKRRQSILKCAGEIIASEGIGALTMSRLAEGAGVTIPTVHNLFGKKHDIYEHLVIEMIQKVEQALDHPRGF